MFNAGKLKHRAEFYALTTTLTESGDTVESWELIASRLVSVAPLSSREKELAAGIDAQVSHKIGCRYLADILHSTKVEVLGRVFHVASVINPDESGDELVIMAEEVELD